MSLFSLSIFRPPFQRQLSITGQLTTHITLVPLPIIFMESTHIGSQNNISSKHCTFDRNYLKIKSYFQYLSRNTDISYHDCIYYLLKILSPTWVVEKCKATLRTSNLFIYAHAYDQLSVLSMPTNTLKQYLSLCVAAALDEQLMTLLVWCFLILKFYYSLRGEIR